MEYGNDTDLDIEDILRQKQYVATPLVVISSIGLVFNVLTLVVLRTFCSPLSSHYLLVFNQCFNDALVSLFTLVERTVTFAEDFVINHSYLCVMMVTATLRFLAFAMCLMNLIVITVSRFVAVYKPTKYHMMFNRKRTLLIINAIAGTFLVLQAITYINVTVLYLHDKDNTFCHTFFLSGGSIVIDVTLPVLYFALLIMMPFCYTYIACVVVRKENDFVATGSVRERRKSINIIVTSFWVVLTFILCFTPYVIVRAIKIFQSSKDSNINNDALFVATRYCGLFPIVNCILDPLIYAVRMPKIRIGYKKCLKCTKQHEVH